MKTLYRLVAVVLVACLAWPSGLSAELISQSSVLAPQDSSFWSRALSEPVLMAENSIGTAAAATSARQQMKSLRRENARLISRPPRYKEATTEDQTPTSPDLIDQIVRGVIFRNMRGRTYSVEDLAKRTGIAPESIKELFASKLAQRMKKDLIREEKILMPEEPEPEPAAINPESLSRLHDFKPQLVEIVRWRLLRNGPEPNFERKRLNRLIRHAMALLGDPTILDWLIVSKDFGKRARERRKRLGFRTYTDFAMSIGIKPIQIQKMEKSSSPSLECSVLQAVAMGLCANVNWLLLDLGSPDATPTDPIEVTPHITESIKSSLFATPRIADLMNIELSEIEAFASGAKQPRLNRLLWLAWALKRMPGYLVAGEPMLYIRKAAA